MAQSRVSLFPQRATRPLSAPASSQPLSETLGLLVDEPQESPTAGPQVNFQYRRHSTEPSETSHGGEQGPAHPEFRDRAGLPLSAAHQEVAPVRVLEKEKVLGSPATETAFIWPLNETIGEGAATPGREAEEESDSLGDEKQ